METDPLPPTNPSNHSGYLTTEFWVAVGNQVAGLALILLAVLGLEPDNSNSQLLIVSGLALMGVQGVGYGISRAIIKRASQREKIYYMSVPKNGESKET